MPLDVEEERQLRRLDLEPGVGEHKIVLPARVQDLAVRAVLTLEHHRREIEDLEQDRATLLAALKNACTLARSTGREYMAPEDQARLRTLNAVLEHLSLKAKENEP